MPGHWGYVPAPLLSIEFFFVQRGHTITGDDYSSSIQKLEKKHVYSSKNIF